VISFLPNIYDSSAQERNQYLDIIMTVAKKSRSQPFVFFWLQAGDQLDLERNLNLGFGFPAVVGISPTKKVIAVMKAAFDGKAYAEFLGDLLVGKAGLNELKTKIELKKVDKWDGSDAPPLD
jgi:hypothetical protein